MRLVSKELLEAGHPKIKSVIYLDGIEQRDVVVADTVDGFIEKYQRDNKGKLVHSEQGPFIKTETLFGKVTIGIASA